MKHVAKLQMVMAPKLKWSSHRIKYVCSKERYLTSGYGTLENTIIIFYMHNQMKKMQVDGWNQRDKATTSDRDELKTGMTKPVMNKEKETHSHIVYFK